MKKITCFTFVVFCLFISNIIFAQPSEPDPFMWTASGPVFSIAVDGNDTYIGDILITSVQIPVPAQN
jgi:hypothetical protein